MVPQAFALNGTNVPAGSLLVFDGYPDTTLGSITALNPSTGAQIARLDNIGTYYFTAGLFDPTSGHLFVTLNQELVELNAATGAEIGRFAMPLNASSYAGLAIDPVPGNLWLGAYKSSEIVEMTRAGVEVRRVDLASQGWAERDIGARVRRRRFAARRFEPGRGVSGGTEPRRCGARCDAYPGDRCGDRRCAGARQCGLGERRPGDRAGGDELRCGHTGVVRRPQQRRQCRYSSIRPLVINDAGTRLQVQVPDQATTGNVRVVNRGVSNLGATSFYLDAIYRNVTASFTAGSSSAAVRFSDGGLQGVDDESWGIDNVVVKRGATTVSAITSRVRLRPAGATRASTRQARRVQPLFGALQQR